MATPLLTGFRFRWRLTSHRLPLLTADAGDPARFALKIGAFPPDKADVEVHRTLLETAAPADGAEPPEPGVAPLEGTTPSLRLAEPLGQVARLTHRVRLPAGTPTDGLVLLQGFAFDRIDHPAGWHFGRLAISLSEPFEDAQGPCFDLHASVRPSESPEHVPFGNKPWTYDQPAACTLVVRWVLLPHRPAEAHAWSGTVPLATEGDLHAPVELPAGSVPALRGFALDVGSPDEARRSSRILRYLTGRYIRELGVGLTPGEPATAWAVASNLPQGHVLYRVVALLSVPALWAVVATQGWSPLGVLAFGPALLMSWVLARWPGGTFRFPVTPWKLEASLDLVALALQPGEHARAEAARGLLDAPEPPHAVDLEWAPDEKT